MRVPFIIARTTDGRVVGRMAFGNKEDACRLAPGAEVLRPDWIALGWLIIKVI